MIIEYDNNPSLTPDQKLQSLKEKVQLALDEQSSTSERLYRSLLQSLGVNVSSLRNDFTSLAERIDSEAQVLAEAVAGALERLDAVEEIAGQVESILRRLSTLEANYTTLAANYTALEARVRALEEA